MRPIGPLLAPPSPQETLGAFANQATSAESLERSGLPARRAAELGARVARCAARLMDSGCPASSGASAFIVPGRIEVLGKHTDYGGGRSLLVATEQAIVLVCARCRDGRMKVDDLALEREATLDVAPDLPTLPGDWSNYLRVVVRWLASSFPGQVTGAAIAFESALPRAAGLSSSSALVTAGFLALCSISPCPRSRAFASAIHNVATLAECLGAIEAGRPFAAFDGATGVGTRGGNEDHIAIVGSVEGHVAQYGFAPVRFERALPLPRNHVFLVATSGVEASKTGPARDIYNAVSDRLRLVEQLSRPLVPGVPRSLGKAIGESPGLVDAIRVLLAPEPAERREQLRARFDQFVAETFEIVPGAADALEAGALGRFGHLVDRSQTLAEQGLGNQVAETSALQRLARASGAVAASAFGAGFGGSVWALVHEADAGRFEDTWRAAFLRDFPAREPAATFFRTGASRPAQRVRLGDLRRG